MKAIGKKKVKDLVFGDIFSVNEREFDETAQGSNLSQHTFNFICYRQNDTVDIEVFGCHEWNVPNDNTEVYFFGRRAEERFMTDDEKKEKVNEIWNSVFSTLPNEIRTKIENAYHVKLFGKRGYYAESGERTYIKNSLKGMRDLAEIVEGKTIKKITTKQNDNIEDLDHSIRFETECYGYRETILTIEFLDDKPIRYYY